MRRRMAETMVLQEAERVHGLPVVVVVNPADEDLDGETMDAAYTGDGSMVNSGDFDGMANREPMEAIAAFMDENDIGKKTVSFRLRDWGISRQRYWGAPIPMIHCGECGCYSRTPHAVFLAWFRDVLEIITAQNVGYALWNFRGNFGILDSGRADVDYEDWHGHKLDRSLLSLLQEF